MKRALLLVAAALAFGCSTPQSRIREHQDAFNAYPAEVQQRIRQGQVAVGFTPEQTAMALGKPDRVYTRTTPSGGQEIWAYGRDAGSSVGFGIGVGSFGAPVVYDAGIGVGTDASAEFRTRVVFEAGRVVSVERRER